MNKLDQALTLEINQLKEEGRDKKPERVIVDYIAPSGTKGPRYKLLGSDKEYIRLNSNSYLSLSHDKKMIAAADEATHRLGVGPGAVRFIDGTFQHHIDLEKRIAEFCNKPAAKIFNSAYTANLALALTLFNKETYFVGDELNHNSIIRAMRISNVPRTNRSIFKHNDVASLKEKLEGVPRDGSIKRVFVIFDGIFSMRGDSAPMAEIKEVVDQFKNDFEQGVYTIVDDSHGIGAYGANGRGTEEHTSTQADIIVGTFGKAFGVNGGFIAGSEVLAETVRQKADTYIYTNPLSVADCAAAVESINIVDSEEGKNRLSTLQERISEFREGIQELGIETIDGPHSVVPLLIRNTEKTHFLVQKLYENGVLVVGLTFPVVPKGNETIRVQINAGVTKEDVQEVLDILKQYM